LRQEQGVVQDRGARARRVPPRDGSHADVHQDSRRPSPRRSAGAGEPDRVPGVAGGVRTRDRDRVSRRAPERRRARREARRARGEDPGRRRDRQDAADLQVGPQHLHRDRWRRTVELGRGRRECRGTHRVQQMDRDLREAVTGRGAAAFGDHRRAESDDRRGQPCQRSDRGRWAGLPRGQVVPRARQIVRRRLEQWRGQGGSTDRSDRAGADRLQLRSRRAVAAQRVLRHRGEPSSDRNARDHARQQRLADQLHRRYEVARHRTEALRRRGIVRREV